MRSDSHPSRLRAPWGLILSASTVAGLCLGANVPLNAWLLMPAGITGPLADLDVVIRDYLATSALVAATSTIVLWTIWRLQGRRFNLRRARRFLRWIPAAAAVSGFLLGTGLGFGIGIWFHRQRLAESERALYQLGAVQWYSAYAQAVYQSVGYDDGVDVLRRQIDFLHRQLQRTDDAGRTPLEYEMGMAYARLFALAESHGDTAAAEEAWAAAANLLQRSYWSDVSKDEVLRRLERIDGALPRTEHQGANLEGTAARPNKQLDRR